LVPFLVAAALLNPAEPSGPVAMVLTTKGKVSFGSGQDKPHRVGAADLLRPGDRLEAADAGEAVLLFLADRHRERLKPGVRASISKKGCTPADAVEVLPPSKLAPVQAESLRDLSGSSRGAVGILRGEPPPTPQVATPIFGAVVLTDRPALSWLPVEGADGYRVELRSGDGQRVLWRVTVKEPRLPYPDKPALRQGAKYLWRVSALLGEDKTKALVDSKFQVGTKGEINALAPLADLPTKADAAALLLAAVTYEAHGVYDKAIGLYEELARRVPDAPNFQEALANYYERAGRADKAKAAQKKAAELRPK
jgi:tetratricopeptide (TPR) repeat protein